MVAGGSFDWGLGDSSKDHVDRHQTMLNACLLPVSSAPARSAVPDLFPYSTLLPCCPHMRLRPSERVGLELSRSSSLQGRGCPANSLDRLRSARMKNGRRELNEKILGIVSNVCIRCLSIIFFFRFRPGHSLATDRPTDGRSDLRESEQNGPGP